MHSRLYALAVASVFALAIPTHADAATQAAEVPFAQASASPPQAVTPSAADTLQEFSDVPPDSFAYQAIQSLEADNLIKGYPDGTFKGKRLLTRYEAAVITQRVVALLEDQLKSPSSAQSVSPADVKAVRVLLEEFKKELGSLEKRVARIDERLSAVEKTVDRQQLHVLYFLRTGTFRDQVSAYNGKGVGLPGGTVLAANSLLGSGEKIKRNTLVSGLNQTGNGYQVLRLYYDGNLDPKISYHIQLENQLSFDNASASTNPAFGGYSTASTNPPLATFSSTGTIGSSYPTNTTFRINYANVVYKSPSGLSLTAGRYTVANSGLGLNFNDYFNGGLIGYTHGAFAAQAGYSFNYPALSNGTAGVASYGTSGQTLLTCASYQVTKKVGVGLAWSDDLGSNETLWNPAVGYKTSDVPISVGSFYGRYTPGKLSLLEVEGLHRFGKDPFTGNAWQQPDALQLQGKYGAYNGATNGNYAEAGLLQAGFNSLSGHTGPENTLSYYQDFLTNPNGYRSAYLGVHHWLSQNARIGLVYLHYNLIPATDMPVQTSSGGCASNTCYIGRDNASALFLQTWLQF